MKYKYKYLVVRENPYNTGDTIAHINVSHLNKKGVDAKWDELQKKYPEDKYTVALQSRNDQIPEFEKELAL